LKKAGSGSWRDGAGPQRQEGLDTVKTVSGPCVLGCLAGRGQDALPLPLQLQLQLQLPLLFKSLLSAP
jgi:hypothetical protein